MNEIVLLIVTIVTWLAVVVGLYQRVFLMPKWFQNPPASFERIRKQSKNAKLFWIPLSVLFMTTVIISLAFNWHQPGVRNLLFASLACFGLTGVLSGRYFVKEVLAFSRMPIDAAQTPELLHRTRFWLKWTTVRDVLQFLVAVFVTMAFIHS